MPEPTSIDELRQCVREFPKVLAVGAGTKAPMSAVALGCAGFERILMTRFSGILEYQPGEFTFTARAGTTLAEISGALAGHGQYLPFDPPLIDAGSTLGGTVAAGMSGSGAFHYGPLRDFIIGVSYLDGCGRLIRAGGKVVKNAAGFDLPKFFAGSLGRFGILAELTFKVFPQAPVRRTWRIPVVTAREAVDTMTTLSGMPGGWDAIAYDPSASVVDVRIAGIPGSVEQRIERLAGGFAGEPVESDAAETLWRAVGEFRWMRDEGAEAVVKVPLTPDWIAKLEDEGAGVLDFVCGSRYDLAGNVGYFGLKRERVSSLDEFLRSHHLQGLAVCGSCDRVWFGGGGKASGIVRNLKSAMDPEGKFPDLNER